MNVGKAKVKDEHENKKTATFADVAGEDEEKEELKELTEADKDEAYVVRMARKFWNLFFPDEEIFFNNRKS